MPRGGKKDGKEDQEGGATSSVEPGSTAESKTEGKLEELAGLVTTLVCVQAAKDEQAEKASSIQECRLSMQQQFTEMQQQVSRITQERRQEGDTQDDSQFLRMLHPELEIWIREHDPKTAAEAARLAEVFTSARKGSRDATCKLGEQPGPFE
ncbi:Zinc finger protein 397 [Dissostichus eleginoides]|uniref:Zinc finger protein 397 n=1 Tax=Dissostichus eleginoides TaxID=100907 RepID=A0AAD9CBF9_DISEL|nr:Zinc finger protein 397 [Dissostichus eleginoides]